MSVKTSASACNEIDVAVEEILKTFPPLTPADLDELAMILGFVPVTAAAA